MSELSYHNNMLLLKYIISDIQLSLNLQKQLLSTACPQSHDTLLLNVQIYSNNIYMKHISMKQLFIKFCFNG